MKTVSKKLFSLLLVAVLLVSVLPFQAFAATSASIQFVNYNWNGTYSLVSNYTLEVPTMINGIVPKVNAPDGWRLAGWVKYTPGMTFDQVAEEPVIDFMKYSCTGDSVYAPKFVKDEYTVSFSVGGKAGTTAPAAMTITNNKEFGASGAMPVPTGTPTGYQFGGWKYGDKVLDHSTWYGTKFTSGANITLEAYWVPNTVTVTFYRWNSSLNAYEGIKAVTAAYGSTVKAEDVPTLEQIDTKPSYKAIGWQTTGGADALAVEPASATLTGDTGFYARYQGDVVTLTLDYKTDKLDPDTKDVRIGEKIGNYGGKLPTPTLTGYVFMGWETVNGDPINDDTLFMNSYSKLQAKWAEAANVRLIVKNVANGNDIYNNLIPGGVKNGLLKTSSINLSQYLPAGNSYKVLGYMDLASYNNYLTTKVINSVDNVQCASVGVTEVYVLVEVLSTNTNTGTGNGTGTGNTGNGNNAGTNKPADPTNPATGDNSMIVASMTVMTMSAAALVVFMQLRKRKMF